ncbi:amidohydrolase family protein [Haloglomus halophilum]|uniref:amidohydrolase family protein n=1 Tax=Haloglomus halophilum TaxID=2962672 RepID=UPI0020C95478|nr:amidohydrolase family protein [Haloglomus halophilum]
MAEQIDAYSHIMPRSFFEAVCDIHPKQELTALENAPHLWDIEQRLGVMDEFSIDKQVLTLARPPLWQGLDSETARPLIRQANDEIRQIAEQHPDRFIPVATLPYGGDASLAELNRCLVDHDMAGVQLYSNVDGQPIDSGVYDPVFERVNELGVPIWLHPQLHEWHQWTDEYMEHKMLGWPFDTSVALSRLIFTGVFEQYQNLRVIAHHAGGMLPFFGERIRSFYETRKQYPDVYPGVDLSQLSQSIDDYFNQIYADTAVSSSVPALRCALEFFGPDNLLFGVDYPFGPDAGRSWMDGGIEALEALGLDVQTRQSIGGANLRALLAQ